MNSKLLVLGILLLITACSSGKNETPTSKKLSLLKTIDLSEDEVIPVDVTLKNDKYYVLDWNHKNILVLQGDNKSYLLKTNDFLKHPGSIKIHNNNFLVSDKFTRELLIFSTKGEFLTKIETPEFRLNNFELYDDKILLRTRSYKHSENNILFSSINYNGEKIENFGEILSAGGLITDQVLMNEVDFSISGKKIIAGNKFYKPLLKIIDTKNEADSLSVKYSLGYSDIDFLNKNPDEHYSDYRFLQSIDSDEKNIYLVVKRRKSTSLENKAGHFISDKFGVYLIENKVRSSITDLNELLIFDFQGKLKERINMDIYCNKVKVYKDKLIFIDSFIGKKIYEYKLPL